MYQGQYLLHAECPAGCGEFEWGNADDPLRNQFRKWTESDVRMVLETSSDNGTPVCPVDGSKLDVKRNPMSVGTHIVVTCLRCGNELQDTILKA